MTKTEILEKLRNKLADFKRSANNAGYACDELQAQYYSGKEAAYEDAAEDIEFLIREIEAD
jgi:hypothetical protein